MLCYFFVSAARVCFTEVCHTFLLYVCCSELQAQHGCCIAPQLELLRDLLYIDHQQREQQRHQLALLQQQMPDAVTPHLLRLVESLWGEMEGTSGPMELYRSVAFIEADCKVLLAVGGASAVSAVAGS